MLIENVITFLCFVTFNFLLTHSFDQCKKIIYRTDLASDLGPIPYETKITQCRGVDEKCCEDQESCCGPMSGVLKWLFITLGVCALGIFLSWYCRCCKSTHEESPTTNNAAEHRRYDDVIQPRLEIPVSVGHDDRPPPMTPPPNYEDAINMPPLQKVPPVYRP